jgi:quinone-modifying oxidoreductase subunit QmoB
MEISKTVLFGNGTTTRQVAVNLLQKGIEVIIATSQKEVFFDSADDTTAELLTGVTLKNCSVINEGYELTFEKESESISHKARRIVLCDDYQRMPEFLCYGLSACDQVIALSQLIAEPETFSKQDGSIVFLTGIYKEGSALIFREIMEAAIRLANDHAQKVYILTGNLKVAAQGLEALYRETRQAGVIIVKFNHEKPAIEQAEKGGATITFKDEITGHLFRLTPNLIIVDETLTVSAATAETAGILALHQGHDRFAQADNIHRLPILTNRRDMLAAGPSRAVLDREQQAMDIDTVSLACMAQEESQTIATSVHAEIDPGHCVRCLTCFRLCPYGAVVLDTRVRVAENLCEGCGICVAECPKGAINLSHLSAGTPAEQISSASKTETIDDFQPAMVLFCCSRSAVPAASLAGFLGHSLPTGLKIIQVPCAGMISTGDILNAFQNRADGVLVLTCHIDNCHAQEGNQHAQRRVESVLDILARIGMEKERLLKSTLASNMSAEFSAIVNGFAKTLKKMGPALNRYI